jgi:hypothetical protein
MTDIVAQLRGTHPNFDEKPMCEEAADEIERLRAALVKVKDWFERDVSVGGLSNVMGEVYAALSPPAEEPSS